MTKLTEYFWTLAEQLPSLITMIGCIAFALIRWKRHPKVSLMVVLSVGLLFLHALVFLLIFDLVPPLFIKPGGFEDSESVRLTVSLVLGILYNGGLAVAFALLLGAVFMQRKPGGSNEPQPG